MKRSLSPSTVLILAVAAVLLPVAVIEFYVLRHTGGTFMYPLDDTFIHMAVAKNLAFQGNWGIGGHEFESASSSIFYTLLLAGLFKLFSANVLIPFLVNFAAALFSLVVVRRWLEKEGVPGWGQLVILLCLIFLTPMPILLIAGMEHTLQCLFSFLFVFGFAGWLERSVAGDGVGGKWKLPWPVIVYGMMVTFIRYEGLFLIAIACVMLAWYRQWKLGFQLGLISVLPLVVFGVLSVAKGSYFLPNSVLLKSEGAPLSVHGLLNWLNTLLVTKLTIVKTDGLAPGTPRPGISQLATQRLLIILPLVYLAFLKYIRQRVAYGYILMMLLVCTILQLCFASTGWLYRYEAYLVFCSTAIIGVLVWKYGREALQGKAVIVRWMLAAVVFAAGFPFVLRSAAGFTKAGAACVNIYQQQVQMGKFLHRYYDDSVAAANDIGAISYYKTAKNLDLWGLGNIKVARSRKNNYWTPAFLDSLSRNEKAQIAVVFDSWFPDSLLVRWNKVATWTIPNNVICGDSVVCFYAIGPGGRAYLRQSLEAYQKELPWGVSVRYY